MKSSSSSSASDRASAAAQESSPLLKQQPSTPTWQRSALTAGIVCALASMWCILDWWTREIRSDLFGTGISKPGIDFMPLFQFPLLLTCLQFFFMAVFFTMLYMAVVRDWSGDGEDWSVLTGKGSQALVISHLFGTFGLQSLMMPSHMFSLGLFAASRAVDIPTTALLRSSVLQKRFGAKTLQTTLLMSAAACMLFYSYSQLAGCVCIWSGHGIALTGAAFWIVYFWVLALPAVNAVCQESLMEQARLHPVLILALQNVGACALFFPILVGAHLLGFENQRVAFGVFSGHPELAMMAVWLSMVVTATSGVFILVIQMTDSFWAVALRALRVVVWGISMLWGFLLHPEIPLSIACPYSSFWSFVIATSVMVVGAAIYTDRKDLDDFATKGELPEPSKASDIA